PARRARRARRPVRREATACGDPPGREPRRRRARRGRDRGGITVTGAPHLKQVIPTARAILWNPSGRRNPGGRYPLFIEQKALEALNEHFLAVKGQALIGFLLGDLFEGPTSRVRYAVVDSTIRLNQPIYGDKTQVVVSRLWDRIQEELGRVGGHLIGWYHSHPPLPVDLAPGDVQTHEQYFTQPWHLALVLGADRDGHPVAGAFRAGPSETWHSVSLSFYELIEQEEHLAGGRNASSLPWTNFETDDTLVTQAGAAPEAARAAPEAAGEPRSTLETFGSHAAPPPAPRKPAAPPPKRPAPLPPPPPAPKPSAPAPPPPRAPPTCTSCIGPRTRALRRRLPGRPSWRRLETSSCRSSTVSATLSR